MTGFTRPFGFVHFFPLYIRIQRTHQRIADKFFLITHNDCRILLRIKVQYSRYLFFTGVVTVGAVKFLYYFGIGRGGKRVKRLSLLSGGERSLAAVALLIAIFRARPSPFYVMDEVEAALDDTNLGRLLEIFTELRRSSQLIIITHQKRTMEVADALYGITMRDGVTKAVSQRLAQPDRGTAVTPDV